MGYKGLEDVSRGSKRLKRIKERGYREFEGVSLGYKGLQEVTGG